jgi:hypothetical protein
MGTITTLTVSRTGGATAGAAVYVYLRIVSIAAYPVARTFNISYSVNGGAYTTANMVTTTLTVNANATSSSNTLVYQVTNGTNALLVSSLTMQAAATGHTTKTSNSISGFYV